MYRNCKNFAVNTRKKKPKCLEGTAGRNTVAKLLLVRFQVEMRNMVLKTRGKTILASHSADMCSSVF
jgi:hypothetical protein